MNLALYLRSNPKRLHFTHLFYRHRAYEFFFFFFSMFYPKKSTIAPCFVHFVLFLLAYWQVAALMKSIAPMTFENNGRDTTALKRESLYLKESLPPGLPYPDASFQAGFAATNRVFESLIR